MGRTTTVPAVLLAATVWALAAGTAGASVTTVPDAPSYGALVPAPDGVLWHAEETRDGPLGTRIVRVGADGASVTTVSDVVPWGEPRLLADGTMGLIVRRLDARMDTYDYDGFALLRLTPDSGAVASVRDVPNAADKAVDVAVAPDGAVWFARCNKGLWRVTPDGRMTSVPLTSLRCNANSIDAQQGLELAFDPTGAVWFANFCAGRIARVSLVGRVREWRAAHAGCGFYGVNEMLAVDPLGGVF